MPITTEGRNTLDAYVAAFGRLAAGRRAEPAWLRDARRRSLAALEWRGFPAPRDEDWRFTNVSALVSRPFELARPDGQPATPLEELSVPGLGGALLVFVDGRHRPDLSRADSGASGLEIGSLREAIAGSNDLVARHLGRGVGLDERPFAALNTAFFEDGAFLRVDAHAVIEEPVQIVFLSTGSRPDSLSCPRVLVIAGPDSRLRLVETYLGSDGAAGLTTAVTEIVAEDGAVVDHHRLQRESEEAFHIGLAQMHVGRNASVSSHAISLGGRIARHDAVAVLEGEGADCTLNGLYLADGSRLVDNHTEIDHAKPHGTSHELYKGILDGRARGVFNGRIRVRPDAQKTDAKQTNRTLILSDEAQINTTPRLEILANDVKCTHGATVGQLSDEALFYLQTRGIGKADARAMLIRAFAMEVTSRIRVAPLREELDRLLAAKLGGQATGGALS